MISLQCDVCCPPALATNDVGVLLRSGWRMVDEGAELDVCPMCVRDGSWKRLPRRTERFQDCSGGRLPNLFLIGAAKCGTTSLHAYLDTHPEVDMADLKELRFFQDPDHHAWKGFYESQFASEAAVAGESSTMYTRAPALPGVPRRLAAAAPDAKLVYMVRDPVERAVASYLEERFQTLDPRPLEEAFADLEDPYNPYVAASRYAEQLGLFLEHFSREQVLVVPLDDLQQDPGATLARIFRFLDVDPAHVVDTSRRHNEGAAKYEYGGAAARLRRGVGGRLVRRLPPAVREAARGTARRLLSRPMDRVDLSEPLRRRLEAALADDAAALRRMTGMSFPGWSV